MGNNKDSTRSLIADAEALIQGKGARPEGPPPTRELVAEAEKLIKDKRPAAAPSPERKGGSKLWLLVLAAAAIGAAWFFMK